MRNHAFRARVPASVAIALWMAFSLSGSTTASASNVMLVYNSGDVAVDTPGRYVVGVAPPSLTDPAFPADDHQCVQGQLATELAPLEIYVSLEPDETPVAVGTACSEGEMGSAVCGYDLTIEVNNPTSDNSRKFLMGGFTPAVNGYSQSSNLDADGLKLRVNGVKTDSGHTLPVYVGKIDLLRGVAGESTDTNCTTDCGLGLCATIDATKAHIVKANLEMEVLSDTVNLLRLPEPDADTLWWAGAALTWALAARRRAADLPAG